MGFFCVGLALGCMIHMFVHHWVEAEMVEEEMEKQLMINEIADDITDVLIEKIKAANAAAVINKDGGEV